MAEDPAYAESSRETAYIPARGAWAPRADVGQQHLSSHSPPEQSQKSALSIQTVTRSRRESGIQQPVTVLD